MNIGIIGFGGVARAFLQLLVDKEKELNSLDINITYILSGRGEIFNKEGIEIKKLLEFSKSERDISKFPKGESTNTYSNKITKENFDYIIELTPTNIKTGQPAYDYIKEALENKINVITANKGPIALYYKELNNMARENKVSLKIGCTTGGALPTINGGLIDLKGSKILKIEGILNGTSNFILEEMEKELTFENALKKAQDQGIAEKDPTLDVEGYDSAIKLLILTKVLVDENVSLEDIKIKGIRNITTDEIKKLNEKEKRLKLICKTEITDKVKMTVKPEIVDKEDIFYNVVGKNKAIKYTTDTLGELYLIGGASGLTPAAASILRDLLNDLGE